MLFTTFFVGVTSYEVAVKFAQMFGTWKKKLCKCIVSVLIRKKAKTLKSIRITFNIFRDSSCLKLTPAKTKMTIEKQPFEDV